MKRVLMSLAAAVLVVGCSQGHRAANPVAPDLGLGGSIAIHGTVFEMVQGDRQLSADAEVDASRGSERHSARTDAEGKFVVDGLSTGSWTLTVAKSGFSSAAITIEVTGDMAETAIDIALDPADATNADPLRRHVRR